MERAGPLPEAHQSFVGKYTILEVMEMPNTLPKVFVVRT